MPVLAGLRVEVEVELGHRGVAVLEHRALPIGIILRSCADEDRRPLLAAAPSS
jgi:hypothetical protein